MTDHTDPLAAFEDLVVDTIDTRPGIREIESVVFAGLFAGPTLAARIVEDVKPDDFNFSEYRTLAKTVWAALADGRHVDRVTLAASLPTIEPGDARKTEEREALLAAFDQATKTPPTIGKVEAYLSIFVEDAKKRLTRHLLAQVTKEFSEGDLTATAAAAKAFAIVADLEVSRRLVGAAKSEADYWPTYFADLEASQKEGRDFLGLDTGFSHLNIVANGLTEGLFVLGAAPSTGKTTFAKQLADQVVTLNNGEDGRKLAACLFVSLEQSREELRVKTLSRLSGIENRDILRGRLKTNSPAWSKVKAASADHEATVAGRLFILEGDKTTTPDRIRLAALQVKRATGADVVFVVIDYLQIVPTEEDFKDPRSRVDAVVSDLRRLARDLHSPVLAISSLGRVNYDAPTLSAFKESGGIEYGGDLAGVMLRDKAKTKGFNPVEGVSREWKRVALDIVKNRNGERSRIEFDFYPAVSLFVEGNKSTLPDEDPGPGPT